MITSFKVLRGYTSAVESFLVEDYPYGFRLRCQIRYWLEYKPSQGYRLVSQTSNPKAGGVWNKPKASTYISGFACMGLDEKGHVTWSGLWLHSGASEFARFKALTAGQLNEVESAKVATLEAVSRRMSPKHWGEWDAKQSATPTTPPVNLPTT